MLRLRRRIHPFQTDENAQVAWTASAGKRPAARTPRTMKINMTTTCATRNDGSDWGAEEQLLMPCLPLLTDYTCAKPPSTNNSVPVM